jgi:hypothetical protein
MKRLLGTVLLLAVPATASAGEQVFTDGAYFVYREDQSCALYADYPNDVMLRVSYRPQTEQVFFNVVSPHWKARIRAGATYTAVFHFREDMRTGYGVPAVGAAQPGDDLRVGVGGLAPPNFLRRLEGTAGVRISLDGEELTRMSTPGIRIPVGKLIDCSRKHFG